jgi:hypothetical protein
VARLFAMGSFVQPAQAFSNALIFFSSFFGFLIWNILHLLLFFFKFIESQLYKIPCGKKSVPCTVKEVSALLHVA